MNVWFTKGFNNLYHAINDIKKEIPDCKVLCSHGNPSFLGFHSADYTEKEPKFHTKKGFLKYCSYIIEKYNIKLIFPHHKQEWFNEFKSVFDSLGVIVATVAPLNGVNTLNYKNKFYKKISSIKGLNTPIFDVFNSYEQFKILCKSDKFKDLNLCIKPSLGVYGSDFYNLVKPLSKKTIENIISRNSNMLLMQHLDGFEYSADCLAYYGKIIGFVVRKKLHSDLPQVIVNNESINQQVKLLTSSLHLNGMFNIQFKELKGVPYILEINPRLAGRSYYATLAGLNIPALAVKLFLQLEQPSDIVVDIDYGANIINIPFGFVVNKNYEYSIPPLNKESQ